MARADRAGWVSRKRGKEGTAGVAGGYVEDA
jgi:hypothetical protein